MLNLTLARIKVFSLLLFCLLVTEVNAKVSIKYLEPAAEMGDALAQVTLANMYFDGKEIQKDYQKAAYWYKKAADLGEEEAQLALGRMHSQGLGVGKNHQQALIWYIKAAEQNNVDAQYLVGKSYAEGLGTGANWSLANQWLVKAEKAGSVDAKNYLRSKGVRDRLNKTTAAGPVTITQLDSKVDLRTQYSRDITHNEPKYADAEKQKKYEKLKKQYLSELKFYKKDTNQATTKIPDWVLAKVESDKPRSFYIHPREFSARTIEANRKQEKIDQEKELAGFGITEPSENQYAPYPGNSSNIHLAKKLISQNFELYFNKTSKENKKFCNLVLLANTAEDYLDYGEEATTLMRHGRSKLCSVYDKKRTYGVVQRKADFFQLVVEYDLPKKNNNYFYFDEYNNFLGERVLSCEEANSQALKSSYNIIQKKLGVALSSNSIRLNISNNADISEAKEEYFEVKEVCTGSLLSNAGLKAGDFIRYFEGVRKSENKNINDRCFLIHAGRHITKNEGKYLTNDFKSKRVSDCGGTILVQMADKKLKVQLPVDEVYLAKVDADKTRRENRAEIYKLNKEKIDAKAKSDYFRYIQGVSNNKYSYQPKPVSLELLKNRQFDRSIARSLTSTDPENSYFVLSPHVHNYKGFVSKGVNYSVDDVISLFNWIIASWEEGGESISSGFYLMFVDDFGRTYAAAVFPEYINRKYQTGFRLPSKTWVFTIEEFTPQDRAFLENYHSMDKRWMNNNPALPSYSRGYLNCLTKDLWPVFYRTLVCPTDGISGYDGWKFFLYSIEPNITKPLDDHFYQDLTIDINGKRSGKRIDTVLYGRKQTSKHRIPLASMYQYSTLPTIYRIPSFGLEAAFWEEEKIKSKAWRDKKIALLAGTELLRSQDFREWKDTTLYRFFAGDMHLDSNDKELLSGSDLSFIATYYTTKWTECRDSFSVPPKPYSLSVTTTTTTTRTKNYITHTDRSTSTAKDTTFYVDRKIVPYYDMIIDSRRSKDHLYRPYLIGSEHLPAKAAANMLKNYGCNSVQIRQLEENIQRYVEGRFSLQASVLRAKPW